MYSITSIFEGMKAYKTFRKKFGFLGLPKTTKGYPFLRVSYAWTWEKYFFIRFYELLLLDGDWVKPGIGNSVYKTFYFWSEHCIAAAPSKKYNHDNLIPVQSYYNGSIKVLVAEKYSRAANGGVDMQAAGNYGLQFYPTRLAQKEDTIKLYGLIQKI